MTEWKIPVAKDCDNMKYSVISGKKKLVQGEYSILHTVKKAFVKL